jgi:hypothetical protein
MMTWTRSWHGRWLLWCALVFTCGRQHALNPIHSTSCGVSTHAAASSDAVVAFAAVIARGMAPVMPFVEHAWPKPTIPSQATCSTAQTANGHQEAVGTSHHDHVIKFMSL